MKFHLRHKIVNLVCADRLSTPPTHTLTLPDVKGLVVDFRTLLSF